MDCRKELARIYELLNGRFGNLHWWPAEGPFEVIVGAILTQNTAWTNVEKAIAALKREHLLSPEELSRIDEERLADIIRPSGYYNVKAQRLKLFVRFFGAEYAGDIEIMSAEELPILRNKLLGVWGIGPETADSILLYACGKPIFVCDAYTRRILERHHLIEDDADYDSIQELFMIHLPHDAALFNQYHALIVNAGKTFCRKVPKCDFCPLRTLHAEKDPRPRRE
jgi:endonuclease-3 related protein